MKATPGPALSGLLAAAALLAAGPAHAQSAACELLKHTLAERIEAGGVRGYALEAVPARTPVPSGAKAIATCDGGATKMLYWRFGAPRVSARAPSAAQAASVPSEATQPVIPQATPASSPPPVVEATPALPPRPAASEMQLANIADRSAGPPPLPADDYAVAAPVPVPAPTSSVRVAAYWPWVAGALALPLLVALWAWIARRRAYDSAGLPRGPRL